jgi:GMP synthase (glutamine-hydrolysing)
MQLMHVAVNQAVPVMDDPQSGDKEIAINESGRKLTGFPEKMTVHKNHTRAIYETDPHFEILATSAENFTEMMRHRTKPLLGVQFHPEVGETAQSAKMIQQLIDALMAIKKERAL